MRKNTVLFDQTPAVITEETITVPAGETWELHKFQINSVNSIEANITLKLNDIVKINGRAILADTNVDLDYKYILQAGETIKITVSVANALNIDCIGIKIV